MASKLKRIRKYKWLKRMRVHWFLSRMATSAWRKILANRRLKGRHSLIVSKS